MGRIETPSGPDSGPLGMLDTPRISDVMMWMQEPSLLVCHHELYHMPKKEKFVSRIKTVKPGWSIAELSFQAHCLVVLESWGWVTP